MTARGDCAVRTESGIPVVDCVGEIDLTNVHEMHAALTQAAATDAGAIVVVLAQTTYLDSQGVRILFEAADRLGTMRQRMVIVAPRGTTPRRILEIAGADAICPLFETVQAALASLGPDGSGGA